ncbi:hypothetical protein PVAP13_8NG314300 [Panicum virgatum]|uniref:Uncharacterized protein n=1 Tax=Panicum virgatum TaxID=38727 RepID=A0A8T0PLR0_PANVG|nr:hypothetical protein PVAP13_8NG314300 [Panicum virgatum]
MANPPTIVLAMRAEATSDNTIQSIVKNVVDVPPTMGNPNDVLPRRSTRRRRGRAGDRFQPIGSNVSLKLTDDEIDEDIYALTGALPHHHPRRRPAPLQEMLNMKTPPLPPPPPPPRQPTPSSQPSLVLL